MFECNFIWVWFIYIFLSLSLSFSRLFFYISFTLCLFLDSISSLIDFSLSSCFYLSLFSPFLCACRSVIFLFLYLNFCISVFLFSLLSPAYIPLCIYITCSSCLSVSVFRSPSPRLCISVSLSLSPPGHLCLCLSVSFALKSKCLFFFVRFFRQSACMYFKIIRLLLTDDVLTTLIH